MTDLYSDEGQCCYGITLIGRHGGACPNHDKTTCFECVKGPKLGHMTQIAVGERKKARATRNVALGEVDK